MEKLAKRELSQQLREAVTDAPALVLIEYDRLTVAESESLRGQFREAGCTFRVYKNSIVRFAVEGTKHEPLSPLLKGVTGVAYNADDPGAPARVARDFAKTNDKVSLKGAVMDGELLDAQRVNVLADMPGPLELKATFLRLLTTPATNMVRVLSAPGRNFLNVLNAKKDKDAA